MSPNSENSHTLLTEIEKDLGKWGRAPYLWLEDVNSPKLINRFNASISEIPIAF